jgi:hypothetical protein
MDYKLYATKTIHWDEEGVKKLHPDCVIRWVTTAEIYKVYEGKLPIILEATPTLLDDDDIVFSSILHTKALLTFNETKDPITDIIKMWKECYKQEVAEFRRMGKGTIIEFLDLEDIDHKPDATFNGAYNLRGAAIKRKLVKLL